MSKESLQPMPKQHMDPRYATTLAHGLDLLEAFADGSPSLTNSELAARTGLSKGTISRLTLALASRGLMEDSSPQRGYRVGMTALTLGYPLLTQLGLRHLARLPMKRLAEVWGGTVSLGMRDRHRMVYVETLRGSDPATFSPDVGAALPMIPTAMGRAWLASADSDSVGDLAVKLRMDGEHDTNGLEMARRAAQDQLRRWGFCASFGEWLPDIHAVAIPLNIQSLGERLILTIGIPTKRLKPGDVTERIGPSLKSVAREIEACWSSVQHDSSFENELPGDVYARSEILSVGDSVPSVAQTLVTGIDLLLLFGPQESEIGNREIARRLGVAPQTVVRLTHTLCERGYLKRSAENSKYQLGCSSLTSTYPLLSSLRIRRLARGPMLELSEQLGAAVSLGLEHRAAMIYVETAWRTDERLTPPDIGAPMPILRTAIGRAWLGYVCAEQRSEALNRIRLRSPAQFARYYSSTLKSIDFFRKNGWCFSTDFHPNIVAIAAPIRDPLDNRSYVMNCGIVRSAAMKVDKLGATAERLREAIIAIEATL